MDPSYVFVTAYPVCTRVLPRNDIVIKCSRRRIRLAGAGVTEVMWKKSFHVQRKLLGLMLELLSFAY